MSIVTDGLAPFPPHKHAVEVGPWVELRGVYRRAVLWEIRPTHDAPVELLAIGEGVKQRNGQESFVNLAGFLPEERDRALRHFADVVIGLSYRLEELAG